MPMQVFDEYSPIENSVVFTEGNVADDTLPMGINGQRIRWDSIVLSNDDSIDHTLQVEMGSVRVLSIVVPAGAGMGVVAAKDVMVVMAAQTARDYIVTESSADLVFRLKEVINTGATVVANALGGKV